MMSKQVQATFQYNVGRGEERITVGVFSSLDKSDAEWKDYLAADARENISKHAGVCPKDIVVHMVSFEAKFNNPPASEREHRKVAVATVFTVWLAASFAKIAFFMSMPPFSAISVEWHWAALSFIPVVWLISTVYLFFGATPRRILAALGNKSGGRQY